MKTRVGSIEFKNPLLAASGTWAYGLEFLNEPWQKDLAGFVTKSLSIEASTGNPMPRLYETDGGMLNSIGLQNMGIQNFLKEVEPRLQAAKLPYILSVYAHRKEDFQRLAAFSRESSALAVELNISCPNIERGGLEFSSEAKVTEDLLKTVKPELNKPLWVKLSPNVTRIEDMAMAAEAGGADAISLINTLVGMSIDVDAQKPWLGKVTGGLSGPAIRPVAVEKVYRSYRQVKIPLVGMGGIRCARDVLEFLMAGASAVQVGTWNFREPQIYEQLARDLRAYLEKYSLQNISDLVGLAHEH